MLDVHQFLSMTLSTKGQAILTFEGKNFNHENIQKKNIFFFHCVIVLCCSETEMLCAIRPKAHGNKQHSIFVLVTFFCTRWCKILFCTSKFTDLHSPNVHRCKKPLLQLLLGRPEGRCGGFSQLP